jgi:methoxymalonate biosynthesis acyl carrier protein
VKATIREYIVSSWLNGDHRGLKDDTDLQESGLLDSLTTLSLVSFLEESFKIQLDPGDINAEAFRTLDAVSALVARKMGDSGAS